MKNKNLFGAALVIGIWSLGFAAAAVPIISNEELVSIADDHVVITWQTSNETSNSGIKYGLTTPPSTTYTSDEGSSRTQYHYLALSNLSPNTTYFYKIFSHSSAGTTEGTLSSFKTLARPSGNYLFTFATLTDLHYAPDLSNTVDERGRPYNSSEAIVGALVSAINQFAPAFTIIKGDMIEARGGTLTAAARLDQLKTRLDNLTSAGAVKYYPIPGNHDKTTGLDYGAGNWVTENLGDLYPPGAGLPTGNSTFNYSFTYNGYRFIMLDSVTNDGVSAEVNTTSLEAELQTARSNNQKAFIFMHHEASEEADIPNAVLAAVLDEPTFDWNTHGDRIRIRNKNAFFNSLDTYKLSNNEPVAASVFTGHIHDNRRRDFNGIPVVRTASGLQFPTGYNIYKVYSNGYTQTFYKLRAFAEEIARALITGTGEVTKARAEQFYLGGGTSRNFTVTYSAPISVSPTVESTQPAAGATSVALNQPIIITFTKAMTKEITVSDWLTISQNGTNVSLTSSDWSWNSAKTILTISKTLVASKTYTVTIVGGAGGAAATDGSTFAANYVFTFSTGTQSSTTPPAASVIPLRNESGSITNTTTDTTPTFTGITTDEAGSTIAAVELRYKTDTATDWGSWYSASPLDGTFNSATEFFTFTLTTEVGRGKFNLQVRTTNSAGVTTTASFAAYSFWVLGTQPEIVLKADGTTIINGDPLSPTPSFEVTVAANNALTELRFVLDGTATSILPANPSFENTIFHRPTLAAGTHNIRIEAVDSAGQASTKEAINLSVQTTGDVNISGTPLNFPNPFNAGSENTAIAYVLSRGSAITITIHDLMGNVVSRKNYPVNDNGGRAGYNEVTWDGRSDGGAVVGNGLYIYLILADGKIVSRGKIAVVKR